MKLLPLERNMIAKFRCNNIKLPIETGRWSNTPREERICHLCNVGLGTEFHFVFECTLARTYFDSTFEFERAKFYCIYMLRSHKFKM